MASLLPGEQTLLQFRAGKMVLQNSQVLADPRKGLCRILRGEEGLVHVQWLDRTSNRVEDDVIVFPDEAIFEKVQQSSSRVYILKFKDDARKFFFWLQEPRAEGDSELCSSVNYQINRPLELGEDDDIAEEPTPTADNPVDVTPSVGGAEQNQAVQLSDLQRILSSLNNASGSGDVPMYASDPGPTLSEVLKVDNLLPLLENCHLEERLSPYLPEGEWTMEAILELMKSPQFRQQLDMFSMALRSGQMDLSQFGIDPSKCDYTVASFLEAIEDQMSGKREEARDDMDE